MGRCKKTAQKNFIKDSFEKKCESKAATRWKWRLTNDLWQALANEKKDGEHRF